MLLLRSAPLVTARAKLGCSIVATTACNCTTWVHCVRIGQDTIMHPATVMLLALKGLSSGCCCFGQVSRPSCPAEVVTL